MINAITDTVVTLLRREERRMFKTSCDRRKANVRYLLRNYHQLNEHTDMSVYAASQANDEELRDVLEAISGHKLTHARIPSIMSSVARTRLMMDHVNAMLDLYRLYCRESKKPEDARRARVLYWLYLSERPKTVESIADEESIDVRTVYRDIDSAVERLTALIFGVDGLSLLQDRREAR
jgi:hypothetical protein